MHVYIADGPQGGLVIIDTAMPGEETFDRISRGIASMGRQVEEIEAIYLTHCHFDHFGGAGLLQQASGAPVICHPNVKVQLERMRNLGSAQLKHITSMFVEHGQSVVDGGGPETLEEIMGSRAAMFSRIVLPDLVLTIDEGDRVAFAGRDWDTYWTPGHEVGHVVFYHSPSRLCIVGDTVLRKITPHVGWLPETPDPLGQFLSSLKKVAALDPALALPGHGRPFDHSAERARSIAAHHVVRLRRCREILLAGGRTHALQVARKLFDRDLVLFEERLALGETLSHLEYLRLRGQVHREMVDGVWLYDASPGAVA